MITITPSPIRNRARRGFTLVEMMVGASLASFILAGVLSTFLFLGRSGANLRNYSDMEAEARKGLELFAEDTRQASAITWNSATSVRLTVNATSITYAYDSTTRRFTRNGAAIISNINAGTFSFKAYNVAGAELPLVTATNLTTATTSTKQLQISLEASRTTQTVATATNTVLSARFILRNRIVTA